MKREIKFKAKRLDGKGWIEGTPICINGKPYGILIGEKESPDIDPNTVCQFTGLKDDKGNEIWEGDLLTNRYFKDIYEVVWREDDACFKIVNTCYRESIESLGCSIRNISWCVVGNKFDKK